METLHAAWEVPAVAHFCSLFRQVFSLVDFDIEEFEEALISDTENASIGGRSSLIVDQLIALLQGCTGRRDITILNYNQQLFDYLRLVWELPGFGPNPLGPVRENASFHLLELYPKLKILHLLCELRLDRPDVENLTRCLSGDSLRLQPLGTDRDDRTYWYFYGTRLYREDAPVKKHSISTTTTKKQEKRGRKRKRQLSDSVATESEAETTGRKPIRTSKDLKIKIKQSPVKDRVSQPEEESGDSFLVSGRTSPSFSDVTTSQSDVDIKRETSDTDVSVQKRIPRSRNDSNGSTSSSIMASPLEESQFSGFSGSEMSDNESKPSTEKDDVIDSDLDETDKAEIKSEDDDKMIINYRDQPLLKSEQNSRWHLVCSTLDDWQLLTDKFSNSRFSCEKELFQLLRDDFLGAIDQLFQQREKDKRKKMDELAPRRTSDRLEVKRLIMEHDSRDLEERENVLRKHQNDVENEKQRKQLREVREQRLREREKQRELREKEYHRRKEERGRRADYRRRRQELMLTGDQLPDELRLRHDDESDDNNDDDEFEKEHCYGQLEKILHSVQKSDDAWPFDQPVSEEIAPDYFTVIKNPMDLSKIEDKLLSRQYQSRVHFVDDMNLIFINCFNYNGPKNEYTRLAKNVEKVLVKAWRKYFPPNEMNEYQEKFQLEEKVCVEKLGALHQKFIDLLASQQPVVTEVSRTVSKSVIKTKQTVNSTNYLNPGYFPSSPSRLQMNTKPIGTANILRRPTTNVNNIVTTSNQNNSNSSSSLFGSRDVHFPGYTSSSSSATTQQLAATPHHQQIVQTTFASGVPGTNMQTPSNIPIILTPVSQNIVFGSSNPSSSQRTNQIHIVSVNQNSHRIIPRALGQQLLQHSQSQTNQTNVEPILIGRIEPVHSNVQNNIVRVVSSPSQRPSTISSNTSNNIATTSGSGITRTTMPLNESQSLRFNADGSCYLIERHPKSRLTVSERQLNNQEADILKQRAISYGRQNLMKLSSKPICPVIPTRQTREIQQNPSISIQLQQQPQQQVFIINNNSTSVTQTMTSSHQQTPSISQTSDSSPIQVVQVTMLPQPILINNNHNTNPTSIVLQNQCTMQFESSQNTSEQQIDNSSSSQSFDLLSQAWNSS